MIFCGFGLESRSAGCFKTTLNANVELNYLLLVDRPLLSRREREVAWKREKSNGGSTPILIFISFGVCDSTLAFGSFYKMALTIVR